MSRPSGLRRTVRAAVFSLPLALTAVLVALARYSDVFQSPPLLYLRDGLPVLTLVAAVYGALLVAWLAGFGRSPREVDAMAGTVATLQHDLETQQLELRATVDFLTAEREIGLILGEDVEFRAIQEKVLAIIANLLGGRADDEIEVHLRSKESGDLELRAAWAAGKARFDRSLAKLRRQDDLVSACLTQGVRSAEEGGRLSVAAPLEYDGEVIGALRIGFEPGKDGRARILVPRLGELARFVALAIKTPDLYTRAVEDGLTGLATKRHFQTQIEEMIERARRHAEPLSIVMVDIDHFKKINDSYGHLTGDVVLKGVAELLKKGVRLKAGDRAYNAYRYGGEEMSVLLPRTTVEKAAEVAERLRLAIEARVFAGEKRERVTVTASFGVAQFDPASMRGPEDLVSRADEALYRAKEGGRNRVVVTPSAVPATLPG